MMKLVDCHSHTVHYSTDAAQTVDELLQDAKAHDLAGICLTDHYDKDVNYTGIEHIFNLPDYFSHLDRVRAAILPTDPPLYTGIELGWMPHLTGLYNEIIATWPFDSVILSLHNMDGDKDIFIDRSVYDEGAYAAYSRALTQMVAMMSSCPDFTILGHYDYVSRYFPGQTTRMDYAPLAREFDALFEYLIVHGKALELNTRTALKFKSQGLTGAYAWPDPAIFKRYLELGGQYISLSSDSHQSGQAATLFPEAIEFLKSVGVSQLTHFVSKSPILTPLS